MKSRDELHAYWSNPEPKNAPAMYINHEYRTKYLVGLVGKYANPKSSFMELGCNVGRNLHGLWKAGYHDISGIEINEKAIDLMRETYPDLGASIYVGQLEHEVGETLYRYDFVFSMCVLMHVHPDSEFIFADIAKMAKKYIITIEDEVKETWRHCPRNYKDVFEPFGFKQVFEEHVPWGENGVTARVLKSRVD